MAKSTTSTNDDILARLDQLGRHLQIIEQELDTLWRLHGLPAPVRETTGSVTSGRDERGRRIFRH